LFLND